MIDLSPHHLETVKRILAEHVPDCEVRAFGSRATWTAWEYSDLDLAVVSHEPLDRRASANLREAFEESDLPIRVDVVEWATLTDGFRQAIEGDCVVVQEAATPSRWLETTVGDVVDLTLSSVDKKTKPDEIPVRLCNYMDVYRNQFIHDRLDFMTATATEREISRCSLQSGDVLITKDSEKHDDIGVPALVTENIPDLVCGYHLAILRPSSTELDGPYLFHALSAPQAQQQFHSYANGVTRFGLRKADIGLVEIPLPPLDEQRRIADILSALDDKIELNRRMSHTLEGMAQALFKSWFVDFDPVRAKAQGQPTGLPPELDALFPNTFQDSELGEIPSGWKVGSLGDICLKPQYGYTQSAQMEPVGPQFLRITDINKRPWIEWESVPHCEITPDDFEKYRLHNGDILIARMADPGHGCMVECDRTAVFASYLIRFRPLRERYARYLQYWLRSEGYWELVRGRRTGTTRANLNAKALRAFPLVVPAARLLDTFGDQLDSLRPRIVTNAEESHSLAELRETLLPPLLEGWK